MQHLTPSSLIDQNSLPNTQAEGVFDDPLAMVVRMASGKPTALDLQRLAIAARNWIDSNGEIPLERFLRLPSTPEKHRISERNRWLCEAIKLLPEYHLPRSEKSNQAVIDRLADEWKKFASDSAVWKLHRDDAEPPSNTLPLYRCLFFATSKNRSETLSAKQIKRHVGHVFHWKCP